MGINVKKSFKGQKLQPEEQVSFWNSVAEMEPTLD